VGLSATKGLAFALGIPILGVPTLDALAYSQAGESFPVWAIVQAGRGRICAAMYRVASGWPERVGEYRLGKIDLVVDSTDEPCVLCGEIEPSEADMLRLRLGPRLARIAIEAAPRRAVYVAELAWARLQRGESDDLASLAPIYLPQPSVI
jgi:tRNA threonylcarbamoyladenosine biosynthesis protein TsaB